MSALETVRSIPSALIFAMTLPGCASGHPVSTGTPTIDQMSELWMDVAGSPRDLRDGPGADSPKPEDGGRYEVLEIDTAGYSVTQGQREEVRQVTVENGRVIMNRRKLSEDKDIARLVLIGRGDGAARLRKQLPIGTEVEVTWALAGSLQMAISGNRFLVHDGIIRAIDDRELHPRTAVGVDHDTGEVLLLVIDGRSSRSRGYTMVELANMMVDLGADEAVNLDGGGSSTLVGKNRNGNVKVLNHPSSGFQRWVANAIEVTYTKPG